MATPENEYTVVWVMAMHGLPLLVMDIISEFHFILVFKRKELEPNV